MKLTVIDQVAGDLNRDQVDKRLLLPNGRMKLLPATEIDAIEPNDLAYFTWRTGRYGLVTIELIKALKETLEGLSAIEIGAGNGDLGYHLGIVMTDSKLQEKPEIRQLYETMNQPVIKYPADVLRLEALAAVKRMMPAVVVASWVTEYVAPDEKPGPDGGSMYGVEEDKIINQGVSYLLIGNEAVHGNKKIRRKAHCAFNLEGLRSRGEKDLDTIYIWGNLATKFDAIFGHPTQSPRPA